MQPQRWQRPQLGQGSAALLLLPPSDDSLAAAPAPARADRSSRQPLALRCATDGLAATEWSERYEPLFDVYYLRKELPYDPFRPWKDANGRWYAGIAADACNGSAKTNAVPCAGGGQIDLWSAPRLRGPYEKGGVLFRNNRSIYPGRMSDHGLQEFVTIDVIGALPGDPSGDYRVVLNNC